MADIKRFTSSIENEELFLNTIKYLSDVIDAKDEYTIGHSERVQRYSMRVGKRLKLKHSEMDVLYLSSILHDIGKVKVPLAILKSKRKLNRFEFMEIKRHSVYGAYLLGSFRYVEGLQDAIKYHHERVDGKGYPEGLKGKSIPLFSRIIAVCDSFDAMTSKRKYKNGIKSEKHAINEIRKNAGTQFDAEAVDAFMKEYSGGYIHLEKGLHFLKQQNINSYENALFYLQQAKRRVKETSYKRFIDFNIGIIYLQQGRTKESIRYLKSYEPYAKTPHEKADVYNELSSAYYFINDYEKASFYAEQVLKIKSNLLFEKSRATRHIAMVMFKKGVHPAEIFKYIDRSNEMFSLMEKRLEDDKRALAKKGFSIVKYNQLINDTREIKSDLAKYYDATAFIYLNMGKFEMAVENYMKSIDIKHFYGDIYGSIRSQAGLALVFIEQGKFKDAEYQLFEALSYAKKMNNKMGLWMVYNNLGRLYMTWKKNASSVKYYRESFNTGVEIKNKSLLTESIFFLTRLDKSEKAKKRIVDIYDDLPGKVPSEGIMTYLVKNKNRRKDKNTEFMFERTLETLKENYRLLEYAKLYYNYVRYLKEKNSNKYRRYVSGIPGVIKPISDSIVRRRLEKIYDLNSKISGGSGA